MSVIKKSLLLSFFFVNSLVTANTWLNPYYAYNWDIINLDDAYFWHNLNIPKTFNFGVATSAFQLEGSQSEDGFIENNWTKAHPEFSHNVQTDHWNFVEKDIELIKNLGINQYRLSISWSKIEPGQPGIFNQAAMDHYIDLCRRLRDAQIEPIVCFYHFEHPLSFESAGEWVNLPNIEQFLTFCRYVHDQLKPYVKTWLTFNEPIAYGFGRYLDTFPPKTYLPRWLRPFKVFQQMGLAVKNMLIAHTKLYTYIKQEQPKAQVGIAKVMTPCDPPTDWPRLTSFMQKYGIVTIANHISQDAVLEFLKTGKFIWHPFRGVYIEYSDDTAPFSLDFIGINYYTRTVLGPLPAVCLRAHPSGMEIYAEGLYRCIERTAELKKPIIITENGIKDVAQEDLRNTFIKRHLYAIQQALQQGYDVRGYHVWTIWDCGGWRTNYKSTYGLYANDKKTNQRTLRDGSKPFVNYLQHRNEENNNE